MAESPRDYRMESRSRSQLAALRPVALPSEYVDVPTFQSTVILTETT